MTKKSAKPNYQLSTPSPEQQAVINALINQQENVVCKACLLYTSDAADEHRDV